MKIGFITLENPYCAQNIGGIGTYTRVMAEGLSSIHHEVHIITLKSDYAFNRNPDVQMHYINTVISTNNTRYLEYCLNIYNQVQEVHRQHHLDVIEAPEWFGQGYMAAQERIVPIITRLHTPLFLIEEMMRGQKIYQAQDEIKLLEEKQAGLSRLITSPSRSLANIVQGKWGIPKIHVLPNPIDVEQLHNIYFDEGRFHEFGDYILFIGRLEMRKGVLVLSRILSRIFKKFPGVNIVLCGRNTIDWKQRKTYKSMILEENRNYRHRIKFLEHANQHDKLLLMKKARAVVLPSIWENFPYVALEAMGMGATVVASNTGGFREMISNNVNGYLFESENETDLLHVITKALDNKLDENNIRKSVMDNYDSKMILPQYVEICRKVME